MKQKQVTQLVIILLLLAGVLLGCSQTSATSISELDKQFATAVPLADINKSLQIAVDDEGSSFVQSNPDIALLIYNKSQDSINLDNSSFVRLLVSTDKIHWVDVENEIIYEGPMMLSPKGTPLLDVQYTWAKPILDRASLRTGNQEILLRIVVIGEILEGDTHTGQNVAGYVDVFLTP